MKMNKSESVVNMRKQFLVRADGNVQRIETIDLGFPIGLVDDISEFISHYTTYLNAEDVVVFIY